MGQPLRRHALSCLPSLDRLDVHGRQRDRHRGAPRGPDPGVVHGQYSDVLLDNVDK